MKVMLQVAIREASFYISLQAKKMYLASSFNIVDFTFVTSRPNQSI